MVNINIKMYCPFIFSFFLTFFVHTITMKLYPLFVTILCFNIALVFAGGNSHLDKYELARYIAKRYAVKNAQIEKRARK
jgi:hypothetical protein